MLFAKIAEHAWLHGFVVTLSAEVNFTRLVLGTCTWKKKCKADERLERVDHGICRQGDGSKSAVVQSLNGARGFALEFEAPTLFMWR